MLYDLNIAGHAIAYGLMWIAGMAIGIASAAAVIVRLVR